jgi:hypothetical protein
MIELLFEQHDIELVNKLSKIFEKTEARETKLSNITEKIYKELHALAQSIDVMGTQKGNTIIWLSLIIIENARKKSSLFKINSYLL